MEMSGNQFFWVVLITCLLWLLVLVVVLFQIFNRKEISIVEKLLWTLIILSFPVLGLIIYLVVKSSK